MTGREREWQAEWDRLRGERRAARARWRRGIDVLAEKAGDPFGVKKAVQAHPLTAAGISAAIGAMIGSFFSGGSSRRRVRRHSRVRDEDFADAPEAPSVVEAALRQAAMQIVMPMVTNFVQDKLAQYLHPGESRNGNGVEA